MASHHQPVLRWHSLSSSSSSLHLEIRFKYPISAFNSTVPNQGCSGESSRSSVTATTTSSWLRRMLDKALAIWQQNILGDYAEKRGPCLLCAPNITERWQRLHILRMKSLSLRLTTRAQWQYCHWSWRTLTHHSHHVGRSTGLTRRSWLRDMSIWSLSQVLCTWTAGTNQREKLLVKLPSICRSIE